MEIDESLLELYRSEVETHMATLNDRLLALERDPAGAGGHAELMRAAHSIKGAARIVGLQPAVDLSHGIEDCFVGVGRGQITLARELVDVLLEGVDLLQRVTLIEAAESSEANEPSAAVAKYLAKLAQHVAGGSPEPPRSSTSSVAAAVAQGNEPRTVGPFVLSADRSLDSDWVAAHRDTLLEWHDAANSTLRLDLSAVERVDATGALMLARLHEASRGRPPSVGIQWVEMSPRVRMFLESMGLVAASPPTGAGG